VAERKKARGREIGFPHEVIDWEMPQKRCEGKGKTESARIEGGVHAGALPWGVEREIRAPGKGEKTFRKGKKSSLFVFDGRHNTDGPRKELGTPLNDNHHRRKRAPNDKKS